MPAANLYRFIIFIISLSGISYQFLIARVLLQFSQDESFNQSITLGVYLLSMGIGAWGAGKFFSELRKETIFQLEIINSVLGFLIIPGIYILFFLVNPFVNPISGKLFYGPNSILVMQSFTFLVGLMTGAEIPLFMSFVEKEKLAISKANILGVNYFGALGGALFVNLFLFRKYDYIYCGSILGLFNLTAASLYLAMNQEYFFQRRKYLVFYIFPFIVLLTSLYYSPRINQLFLKEYYLNLKSPLISSVQVKNFIKFFESMPAIERYVTPYQVIDILPEGLMSKYGYDSEFKVYLNNQLQFTRNTVVVYHESMVHGSINVTGFSPKKVLILGGGDGLLLNELSKVAGIDSIKLIELDRKIVDLSSDHYLLSKINDSIFNTSKSEVIIDDAFAYLRHHDQIYDAIFIDFPFPTSHDLSRLYSVEFYRLLEKALRSNGFFVFDAPIDRTVTKETIESSQQIILATLKAAGFKNIFAFGAFESFFVVSKGDRSLQFDYTALPSNLDNKTYLNLATVSHLILKKEENNENAVNSIFRPKRFSQFY